MESHAITRSIYDETEEIVLIPKSEVNFDYDFINGTAKSSSNTRLNKFYRFVVEKGKSTADALSAVECLKLIRDEARATAKPQAPRFLERHTDGMSYRLMTRRAVEDKIIRGIRRFRAKLAHEYKSRQGAEEKMKVMAEEHKKMMSIMQKKLQREPDDEDDDDDEEEEDDDDKSNEAPTEGIVTNDPPTPITHPGQIWNNTKNAAPDFNDPVPPHAQQNDDILQSRPPHAQPNPFGTHYDRFQNSHSLANIQPLPVPSSLFAARQPQEQAHSSPNNSGKKRPSESTIVTMMDEDQGGSIDDYQSQKKRKNDRLWKMFRNVDDILEGMYDLREECLTKNVNCGVLEHLVPRQMLEELQKKYGG